MLLTIHNLPFSYGYTEVKELLKEKCGLHDILLDNFVVEGSTRKVTVGVAEEGDAAIIVRKVNGLYVQNHQLYVEDGRRKKDLDQPFRGSLPAYPQQRYQVPKPQQQQLPQFNPTAGSQQRFPGQGFNNQRFQAKPNDTNQGFANQRYQTELPIQNNVGLNGPLLHTPYVMPTPVVQPYQNVGNMYYMQPIQDQNFMGYPSKNSPITYPTHEAHTLNNQNYQNPPFDSTWEDRRPTQVEEIGFRKSPEQWRPKSRSPRPERQRKEYPRQDAWNNVDNSVREFKDRRRSPKSWDERESRKRRNDSRYERDPHKSFEKRPDHSFDKEGRRGSEKGSLLGRSALQEPHFNERRSREKRPRMEDRRDYRDFPQERSESRPDYRPKDQGHGYPEEMDRPRPPKPELTPEQMRIKRENVDDTVRGQAAALISHEILQQFDRSASGPAIKAVRQLVRQQINVTVGIELQSSIDDVVAAYRLKHAQPHDYRMYTRAMRNTRIAFEEKINERRAAFKGVEPEIPNKKPYIAEKPAKFKKSALLSDPAPNTSKFKWPAEQSGESGHFGNKTYYPKSVQNKPTAKALPQRDVLTEFKKEKKIEYEGEVNLQLQPALEAVLEDEVETIKNIILNSCEKPDDEIEGVICNHIKKGGSLYEITSIMKKSVRKRVLEVKNDLIVRVYYDKRPNLTDLRDFLAPYGVSTVKKSKRKSTDYFVAVLDSYKAFDKFCQIDSLKMGEITIKIKPYHLCGQPPKLTVAQYQKHKRMVINSQIDIKDFGDFDEERDELNQGFVADEFAGVVVPKKEGVKEDPDRGENGAPTKKEKILSEEDIEDLLNVNEEDLEDY